MRVNIVCKYLSTKTIRNNFLLPHLHYNSYCFPFRLQLYQVSEKDAAPSE